MKRAAGVALAGAALTLVAFLFDAAPLFVVGLAFVALGLLAPAWVLWSARGASVRRRLSADRVVEQEPLEATLEVRFGRLSLGSAEVRDPLVGEPVRLERAGRTATLAVVARFERRGLRRIAPPTLTLRDPLELASAVTLGAGPTQDVLVLPRTEPVSWRRGTGWARTERSAALARAEALAAVELDGLRPYRPGTPASRIHWQALARGAGLLERRMQPEADSRPLVVLDARGVVPAEHLDAAVRAAASLSLELASVGGCGLLLPGERRPLTLEPDLVAWPGAHARLAVVEGGPNAPAPVLGTGRVGQLFYVAVRPLRELPESIAGGVDRGACMLVLPQAVATQAPAAPSFAVCGCVGFALGRRAAGSARGRSAA